MLHKSGISSVGLGILEVYLLVGNVKVSAEYDGFVFLQIFQIGAEVVLPLHAVIESS